MDKRIPANRLTALDNSFIDAGNFDAHGGNARFDATLYFPGGERTDTTVFQTLYGVDPGVISVTGDNIVRLLDLHATDISDKFLAVSKYYNAVFDEFISTWQASGYSQLRDDDHESKLAQAYDKFFQCRKTEVVPMAPS
jgi:hypothetical protein